tara:strand:+ start:1392 stop:1628 length:237 start_codon:yes stop_codon:yes gene_type:complete
MVKNKEYDRGALCLISNKGTLPKIGILTGNKEPYTIMMDGKIKLLKVNETTHHLYEVLIIFKQRTTKLLLSPADFKLL